MEPLTNQYLSTLLERGAISVTVEHRRKTLLDIAERAKRSKGHTPGSRWRLRVFREALESMEGNDEIEVTGETFCEVVILAMEAE